MRVAGDVWNTGRYGTNLDSGGVLLVRGTMVVWPGVEVVAGGGVAEEMQGEAWRAWRRRVTCIIST